MRNLEDRTFLVLIAIVSLALAWVIAPFFGAILWGLVAAILFAPLNRRLTIAFSGRRNSAAAVTLLVIIAMIILPAILLGIFLLQEAASIYVRIQSGQIDFAHYFQQMQSILPGWATALLRRLGLTNVGEVRETIAAGITDRFQALAAQAFIIGQSAFVFFVALGVMLYLLFFLLRDGDEIEAKVRRAIPLRAEQSEALAEKFVAVIRATIKGSVIVAIIQGTIGGLVFWSIGVEGALIWGVLMGFFSLLPAIGTGLVWVPVAIYMFVTGAVWEGAVLVVCGLFVIGMVDNILRPILVGREARMPDYIVLVSTLGGIEVFGFHGFIIGPVIAALFMAAWDILTNLRTAAPQQG
ncbi:AI-2E family transporter [Sphingobium boeckii]|uniref:Putative PurR-regulated permease PerM n=1 Tax=Sphingobium boeckii TaxID=1082345 RepID=A0A7W9ECP2_9SPHN|nr:AI-2E family transporter [Sphingobium boeckii]MBB5684094.1 putative PurR-regulated permease PerM [Sphingobium boeckii]